MSDVPVLRARVLASGSAGNAILIQAGSTAVLVDAGLPPEAMVPDLDAAGVRPGDLAAILLTHEHDDHARFASAAARRFRAPVVATGGTLRALRMRPHEGIVERFPAAPFRIGPFEVEAFRIPHDAAEPVGLCLRTESGRVVVALDVGEVTPDLTERGARADLVILEANYEMRLLSAGPYPAFLKNRIAGGRGHLSNDEAALAAVAMTAGAAGPHAIWLTHLSETNNLASLARDVVRAALSREGRMQVEVEAVPPNGSSRAWQHGGNSARPPRTPP